MQVATPSARGFDSPRLHSIKHKGPEYSSGPFVYGFERVLIFLESGEMARLVRNLSEIGQICICLLMRLQSHNLFWMFSYKLLHLSAVRKSAPDYFSNEFKVVPAAQLWMSFAEEASV